MQKTALVCGAGGFIGGHLVKRLKAEGFHAICSVPWGEFRELFDDRFNSLTWQEASYLSMEQQRRRDRES
ncbi:MAG: hypothetical protein HRT64_10010, partial [Erythrobacter sp.]|nr:hypothetical protein [Erythrobacter sp.]